MQLDEILARIDSAFGEELPLSGVPMAEQELNTLEQVVRQDTFQHYLQDLVSRQIIRDYLTNAVLLGHLREDQLEGFADQVVTPEGRCSLSLHMLMLSVEDAASLPGVSMSTLLKPLKPPVADTGARPNLSLVPK